MFTQKLHTYTKTEATRWCHAQGASLGADRELRAAQRERTPFVIPADAGQRVALVAEHLERFREKSETLVCFDDWAVWPSAQRMHIFERFVASYGETRPLMQAPAFLFEQHEYEDLVSFVTLGVLFLWDVHVVGTEAHTVLFYSHDEAGWIEV